MTPEVRLRMLAPSSGKKQWQATDTEQEPAKARKPVCAGCSADPIMACRQCHVTLCGECVPEHQCTRK